MRRDLRARNGVRAGHRGVGLLMIKSFADWLFTPREKPGSVLDVIVWWEKRRIPYNLILVGPGIVGLLLFFLIIHFAADLKPGEDAIEPMALLFAPVLLNICFSVGWVAELFLRFVWRQDDSPILGPVFLKLGLSFSLFVIFSPSGLWILSLIMKVIDVWKA